MEPHSDCEEPLQRAGLLETQATGDAETDVIALHRAAVQAYLRSLDSLDAALRTESSVLADEFGAIRGLIEPIVIKRTAAG